MGRLRSVPVKPVGRGSRLLVCRNVTVSGRRTSLRMEPELWDALEEVARREGLILNQLCTRVDRRRGTANLTASLRVAIVAYFRAAAPPVDEPAGDPDAERVASPMMGRALDAVAACA